MCRQKFVKTLEEVILKAHELQLADPQKDPEDHDAVSLMMTELQWDGTRDAALRRLLFQLLQCAKACHRCAIVHRDIKPANMLLDPDSGTLRIIDFGSSADLEPTSNGRRGLLGLFGEGTEYVGLEKGRAAVSPIYSAPEVFTDPDKAPLRFDVFSVAMVYLQMVFPNLADERNMVAFRQQLEVSLGPCPQLCLTRARSYPPLCRLPPVLRRAPPHP